jgi:hypothetical protein
MRITVRPLVMLVVFALACAAPQPPAPAHPEPSKPPDVVGPAPSDAPVEPEQWLAAKEIFDTRCVVCHGCYDAPCQLIMSSHDGLARGANKSPVYEATRLLAAEPSRLFIDAQGVDAWRKREFFPVLPEGEAGDPRASLLVRLLELKREHPMPSEGRLQGFELGLGREEHCPKADEFEEFAKEHPTWGMPYALPGLTDQEHETLLAWVKSGAPTGKGRVLADAVREQVARWETFLNDGSLKSKLSARYIYEHLFIASLYFAGVDEKTFFRIVRSRTRPGEPISEIATRRPFDDPGKEPFYYRLAPQHATVLAKTHMPYALSDARLARYRELFIDPAYEVKKLPSYEPDVSANPFAAFAQLPVRSRYRFMLDEAEFTMMGFIKGPVCRGQVALDVIEDRFWVAFVNPDSPVLEYEDQFLSGVTQRLDLPAEKGSNGNLLTWLKYQRNEKKWLEAKSKFLSDLGKVGAKVSLDAIWTGEGKNKNAGLTIMRHFDSATVVKGFAGGAPKTAWVVGYALFERIHYLLVAGFDVFGNVGHQLNTRMYMDFLRMEGEHNFLALLPKRRRRPLVDMWYRDTRNAVKDQVYGKVAHLELETSIPFKTNKPELELYAMLEDHLSPTLECRYALAETSEEQVKKTLSEAAHISGIPASHMSETSFLEVRDPGGESLYFTILRDSGHTNVANLFNEDKRRLPQEDHLTVLRGFVGSYPNALFSVQKGELATFVEKLTKLDSEQAYSQLFATYGVRRTNPSFWQVSDRMHEAYRRYEPLSAGLFDFNRLEDR